VSFVTAAIVTSLVPGATAQDADANAAKSLLNHVASHAGIDRGVCAMLGFDAEAALQLVRSERFFLHIRHPDAETVAAIRQKADQAGVGIDRVVVEQAALPWMPYADNMIDLVWATQIRGKDLDRLSVDEVVRVLRPQGVAVVGSLDESSGSADDRARLKDWCHTPAAEILDTPHEGVVILRKRPLEGVDQWNHWEHGPDNNPVSTDQVIKAPYLTQFMADPLFICMPSITTAAGGRTFLATGHIAHHRREWDMVNQLIARNGYNGTILWQRQLPDGFLAHRSAFVATDDIFYLLDDDGCLMLDAATGEERGRLEIPGVEGQWKWMVLQDGIFYVMAGPRGGDAKVIKGDRAFGGWSWADLSEGYYQPRVPWGFGNVVVAYDPAEQRVLWKHEEDSPIDSRALAMRDKKLYLYCPDKHFRCLSADSGYIVWTNGDGEVRKLVEQPGRGLVSTPGFRSSCITLATPEALIVQGQTRMNVVALSTIDGAMLWTKRKFTNNPNAIYIDGKVVLGVGNRGSHVAVNPESGEELEDLHFNKAACTRLTACPDSLFVRGEGTLRFDRQANKVLIDGAVRPACNDGVIAANGLLYIGPWDCDCNLSLIGAIARCSAGDFDFGREATGDERLELGDGDLNQVAPFEIAEGDWPTYRANNQRTASTSVRLADPAPQAQPAGVPAWLYAPPRPHVPTPPASAGGMIFTAGDDGLVRALNAGSGQLVWQYATAGPIKATPTAWEGRVYVGSGDGYAYALEAATGRLLWRFRAAPAERRIMIYGRLCSTWPVNTGILVDDGVAYFAAGIVDQDGTYVCALDAKTGAIRWQNNTCGHFDPVLRKGVSAQGNLTIHDDKLLMAGGNQASPAIFDLATGECLNPHFEQGQPKANHGKFVGVLQDQFPIAGGRIMYTLPRNVANKDSFVLLNGGRSFPLTFGAIPPSWNDDVLALVNFRNGKLKCYDLEKVLDRIQQGPPATQGPSDRPVRWPSLSDVFDADGAARWATDLDNPDKFEVLALAATPGRVAAVIQLQLPQRAHPQWQVVAFDATSGAPIWFWRHDLPFEPLPEGLIVGRDGQLIVASLAGQVLSLAPKQPQPPRAVRD